MRGVVWGDIRGILRIVHFGSVLAQISVTSPEDKTGLGAWSFWNSQFVSISTLSTKTESILRYREAQLFEQWEK